MSGRSRSDPQHHTRQLMTVTILAEYRHSRRSSPFANGPARCGLKRRRTFPRRARATHTVRAARRNHPSVITAGRTRYKPPRSKDCDLNRGTPHHVRSRSSRLDRAIFSYPHRTRAGRCPVSSTGKRRTRSPHAGGVLLRPDPAGRHPNWRARYTDTDPGRSVTTAKGPTGPPTAEARRGLPVRQQLREERAPIQKAEVTRPNCATSWRR